MEKSHNKRGGYNRKDDDPMVKISKNLSFLLRHGAEKEGLVIDSAGFVLLSQILEKDFYKLKKIGVEQIMSVVENNEKKRFEVKTVNDENGNSVLYIRATQGHTIKVSLFLYCWL